MVRLLLKTSARGEGIEKVIASVKTGSSVSGNDGEGGLPSANVGCRCEIGNENCFS